MKTIFFNQKSLHRERQADTAFFAKKYFKVLSPLEKEVDNLKTFNQVPVYIKIIAWLVAKIPVINMRRMDSMSEKADYIYTRGDIPLFPKKPFIIELDNPYILTFYNYRAFQLYKPLIKVLLKSSRCHRIVCLSEACKTIFLDEVGKDFEYKTKVLYPRMREQKTKQAHPTNIKKHDHTVRFLFIGLQAKLKGLYETIEAFHRISNPNIQLTIVGIGAEHLTYYTSKDKRIKCLGQMSRKKIIEEIIPQCDILIFASLFESFGIVALEALSLGLGLITSNVFALPEMCISGYNGICVQSPYIKPNKHGIVDITHTTMGEFEKKYLSEDSINKNYSDQIHDAIQQGIINYKIRKQNSSKLYHEKFDNMQREKNFLQLFEE